MVAILGGFITAIGTLVLAYCTWKTIKDENHRFRCNLDNHNYDFLERIIIKNEKIHNFEHIKQIVSVYISSGYTPAQKIYLDLFLDLQSAANEIVRFNNHLDEKYRQYGEILCNLNQRMYILLLILRSRIEWHENLIENPEQDEYMAYLTQRGIIYQKEEKKSDLLTFLEFAYKYYNDIVVLEPPYIQMAKLGNELLQQHYQSLMQEISKIDNTK